MKNILGYYLPVSSGSKYIVRSPRYYPRKKTTSYRYLMRTFNITKLREGQVDYIQIHEECNGSVLYYRCNMCLYQLYTILAVRATVLKHIRMSQDLASDILLGSNAESVSWTQRDGHKT